MSQLKKIDLSGNQITDISLFSDFNKLSTLWLNSNNISDCSVFKRVPHPEKVTELNLGGNYLTDISFLTRLTNLQRLDLQDNSIKNIAPLKNLTQLSILELRNNLITDIESIKNLQQLISLQLQSNPLIELPTWITQLNLPIQWIDYNWFDNNTLSLFDNPLVSPPPEIVKQGNSAIDDYFNSIKGKATAKLNEIKVLLVGEGMAGKTSLLKRFQNLGFDEKESQTHGINVATVKLGDIQGVTVNAELEHCRLHFWDFGGQEIMHASHQFFMSERALYILVLDSRTDSKKYYWLKHIEKLGGNSPIILIMNKMDANATYSIQEKSLNDQFSNLKNRFFKVSCKDDAGIDALLTCLPQAITDTSLFNTTISMDWMRVKNALEIITAKKKYLDHCGFIAICEKYGVSKSSEQTTLLQYLHDLGVVLHFEELNLNNIFVLDPHWVTIGVYKIINSAQIHQGVLTSADLGFILNQEKIKQQEYDPAKDKQITYSRDEQNYLVNIMELFELCYALDANRARYIIPDLLPKELGTEPDLNSHSPLQFVLEYDYLPNPIISRLMLRLKEDIDQGQQWRFGMILHNAEFDCRAKIKANEDTRTIHIWVTGEQFKKQKYFAVIKHALYEINSEFYNLKIKKWIPLPGHPNEFVDYQELLGYEEMGIESYPSGKLRKTFSVSELLDCYSSKTQRNTVTDKKEATMGEGIHLNVNLNNIGNPNIEQNQINEQKSKQSAILTATQEQAITFEINNVMGLFKNIKEDVLDELEIEEDDKKEKKRLSNELNKVESAFSEMASAQAQGNRELTPSTFARLSDFVENLQDENSKINKAFTLLSKGKDKAQKLAGGYNKIAPYFALPVVPDIFLK